MTNAPPRLLLIDDEESVLISTSGVIASCMPKAIVHTASNGKEGLRLFSQEEPDMVIVDFHMPEMDGMEFVKAAISINPQIPIIVLTAHGDKNSSIQFLKEGAHRYIEKPFDVDEMQLMLKDTLEHAALLRENKKLQDIIQLSDDFPKIIGESQVMKELFEQLQKVALTDASVLIQGESGTGKELIAKAIHENSDVKNGPFIPFNCAALPESLIESELFGYEKGAFTGADQSKLGRFELAENGTIFIDEIGELSPNMQVKLLRVLQEKEFEKLGSTQTIKANFRVVSATNRDLNTMVKENTFREDLYYRLSVFPIHMPALRDRGNDIVLLTKHFVKSYAKRYKKHSLEISDAAIEAIKGYPWKGNIRELENVLSRAVILAGPTQIEKEHLGLDQQLSSESIDFAISKEWTEEDLVKFYARKVFQHCNGSKNDTAKFLNINYRTLMSRLSND